MTRLLLNRFAVLAAASVLAAAAGSPALAQTPEPVAASATAPAAEHSATVEGGEVRYFVHGDLASGKTPLLVLHGAFMSSDTMKPLTDLITDRPMIVVDQRGHARTGDLPGPITYENLADDAAAVLADAGVAKADVVGYSMGAGAALQLALRHPERVDHLVIASVSFNEAGNLPGFTAMMDGITPGIFAGTPMEAEFKRLAPDPDAFASVVEKIKVMDQGQDWPAEQIRALTSPTFIIVGDHDIVRPEHAVELYRLRGGGDTARASQPFLTEAPPARLAILPGASHIDVFGDPALLAAMILPFLDDQTRPRPPGLFEDVPGE
ncbi:alpha/beta fold hydrolase [Brevundimonas sp.]|uniref:alpha/beta fold hydrolase n=1 Tax=Brevundimonas sp. TaxID=1871086 RepID=UPI002737EF1A|nr:alpha/beta hydrolase [Brevundimonas sp.]MDP3800923.1 alpha/beta hydrolase [Brevundimonas sp.]